MEKQLQLVKNWEEKVTKRKAALKKEQMLRAKEKDQKDYD